MKSNKFFWGIQEFFSKVFRKIGSLTAKQLVYGLAWGFLLVNFIVTGASIAKFYNSGVIVIPANAADPIIELVFPETYVDANSNGQYDSGETYEDLNDNGQYDDNINAIYLTDGWQPGTTRDYYFEVRNYNSLKTNEVSIEYVLAIKYANLLPLTYELTLSKDGEEAEDVILAQTVDQDTSFYFENAPTELFGYEGRSVNSYCLTITWPSNEDDASYLRMPGEYVSISLNWQQQYDERLYETTLVNGLTFNSYVTFPKTITFDYTDSYTDEFINDLEYVADGSDTSTEAITIYRDNVSDGNYYILSDDPIYANINCQSMFEGYSSLTSITFDNFNTIKTTTMQEMFNGCSSLTSLDLSGFNTSNVYSMTSMFSDCTNLAHIYVGSGWSVTGVKTSTNMFESCSSLPNYSSSAVDKTKANTGSGGYLSVAS